MRKKTRHYPLIYARYIFPVVANILLIVFSFIPNITFTLEKDERQAMSLFELLNNTWYNSRVYLFSAQTQQTSDGILFYRVVFTLLIICALLFLIGTTANVFSAIACGRYFLCGDTKIKNIYTSIIPNRCVMLVLYLTLLPITFFPDILVYLYKHLLLYPVTVDHSGISVGILSLAVIVILFIITLLSRKQEILQKVNIFNYKVPTKTKNTSDDDIDSANISEAKHYSVNPSHSDNTEKLKDLLGMDEDDK